MSVSPGFVGPPAPADLSGTLSGMDVVSQIIAAQEEERKRLAAQTANANQQASGAAQQYQEAAAAPAPDVGALQAFLPTLLGNVASVLSQNPTYQQNAQSNLKQQHQDLIKARSDNLAQLRDVWNQKADAAQRAGDLETTLTARQKSEQLSKTYGELLQTQRDQAAMDRITAQQTAAENRARIAADAAAAKQDARDNQQEARLQRQALQGLNTAIRQDPDIKTFQTVRDGFTAGVDAARRKNSLGDIVLMRMIAKTTDPTTGVREEEFKTFKQAQGTLARFGVALTKEMWGKGQLNEYGRSQMKGVLRDIYSRKRDQYQRAADLYTSQAVAQNVDPALVLRDYTVKVDPKIKTQALTAARKKDGATLSELLDDYPELNDDVELEAIVKARQ